jgi:hypothetical protein
MENNESEDEKETSFNKHLYDKGIYSDSLRNPLKCFFIDNALNKEKIFNNSTPE